MKQFKIEDRGETDKRKDIETDICPCIILKRKHWDIKYSALGKCEYDM